MTELQSLCSFCMHLHFINIIKTVCLWQQEGKKKGGNEKAFANIMSTSFLCCSPEIKERKVNQKVILFCSTFRKTACHNVSPR